MLELTLMDALRYNIETYEWHYLYMVKEGEAVFSIGRSVDPLARLQEHLYGGRSGTIDRLGNFTRCYVKEAQHWTVCLLTLKDCLPLIEQYRPDCLTAEEWQRAIAPQRVRSKSLRDDAIAYAEQARIMHYRPCLNIAGNPQPSPLPAKYRPPEKNPYGDQLAATLWIE